MQPLIVHADWSKHAAKRWMTIIEPLAQGWRAHPPEQVGPPETLFARLRARAQGAPVAFGIDCPIGLPRAYAAQITHAANFPSFLASLATTPDFFTVAATLSQITPQTPFYPARGLRGMNRLAHAQALGLPSAASLNRACDLATHHRPAGAPLFWTLGANQTGKAAISAWQSLFLPALAAHQPIHLWPFAGPFTTLLRPGHIAIAETYPAEALRHLGLRLHGSKRRQSDRASLAPALATAIQRLHAQAPPTLLQSGFGPEADGEDRFDSLLGALCVLNVVQGHRPDTAPPDIWITQWEGWVLGQTSPPRPQTGQTQI